MSNVSENPIDLFEHLEGLPDEVQETCSYYSRLLEEGEGDAYRMCEAFLKDLNEMGYEFDYGLDGVPGNLRLIDGYEPEPEDEGPCY